MKVDMKLDEQLKSRIKEKANRIFSYTTKGCPGNWGMDIDQWDWTPGVGLIAIAKFYDATKDEAVLSYLQDWVNRNQEKVAASKVINSMAPYAILPVLYRCSKDTKDPSLLDTCRSIADWIIGEAPRTREGALEHTVTEKDSYPEQVWADTVFMAVLFLARTARILQNRHYAGQALEQTLLHLRLLEDAETDVLFHGWDCLNGNHMSSARWTRANAWVAAGVPDILEELKSLVEIPKELTQRYVKMMNGLLKFQKSSGLWSTVMDQPDFYEETSGSAGIACGIIRSVRDGLLPERHLAAAGKTLLAVLEQITDEGEVKGVSGGTPVMPAIEDYNRIPVYPALYGQGLVLMLLSDCLVGS